jgi:hypothetical protein
MRKTSATPVLAFVLLLWLGGTAPAAQEAAPAPAQQAAGGSSTAEYPPGEWCITLVPYFWMSNLTGSVGVFERIPPARVDASFQDILDHMDFGLMLGAEAWKGNWGLLGDFVYAKESASGQIRNTTVSLDAKLLFGQASLAYKVLNRDGLSVDVLGGIRPWQVFSEESLRGGIFDGRKGSQTMTWVDPVLGARVKKDLSDKLFVVAYGDFGGFDVGSEFTWQTYGGLGYSFTNRITCYLMYRYLAVDYQKDDQTWDVQMQGAVLAIAFVI